MNIRSKIVVGYMIILLCLLLSIIAIISQIGTLQEEVEYVATHDLEVHSVINELELNIVDMQAGQRGFALTGNYSYLETYKLGKSQWENNLSRLEQLMADNDTQLQRLKRMYSLVASWVPEAGEKAITLKEIGLEGDLQRFYENNTGKNYIDQFRQNVDTLRNTEIDLTQSRVKALQDKGALLKIALSILFVLFTILSLVVAMLVSKSVIRTIREVTVILKHIVARGGDYSQRIQIQSHDEVGELGEAANELIQTYSDENWVQVTAKNVISMYQGIEDIPTLTEVFTSKVVELMDASYGVFYLRKGRGKQERMEKVAAYAARGEEVGVEQVRIGEGLVGQCAKENRLIILDHIPNEDIRISTGTSEIKPQAILIAPIEYEFQAVAVLEIAGLKPFTELQVNMLQELLHSFGTTINSVNSRMEIERLLQESQSMTEELQMQQEELRLINEQLEEQNRNAMQKSYELEQARVELEQYAQKLEQSSQYKSEFLANMSHELRTPLNSMLILSQMLAENGDGNLSDEEKEYAEVIHGAGADLLLLINDILDLSKVEAGKLEIVMDFMNLRELPLQLNMQFQKVAEQKGLTFDIEVADDIPELFYTDVQRLHQIMRNLLSNAFKFTEEGSVTMHMQKVVDEASNPWLSISVTDTGIGIPKDKQAIIFEAFHQADGRTSRKYGGTGLGLSICRELSRLLGGKVTLDSDVGSGSTFTVWLPITVTDPSVTDQEAAYSVQKRMLEEAAPAHAGFDLVHDQKGVLESTDFVEAGQMKSIHFKGKKIMVVDDDVRNVFVLVNVLEKLDVEVIVAYDGEECLKELEKHRDIDMILMDMMMPVMDGYDAIKQIRNQAAHNNLPIIALTAKAMKQDREKCLEAGASDYISKPLNMEQLFSIMRVWLAK